MSNFNTDKIYLSSDGNYKDVNGNVIAKKGQPLTGAAWRHIASKYGRETANRFSMNTRNGNIYLNGKWRLNDIQSDKEGRTASWLEATARMSQNAKALGASKDLYGYYLINPFNKKKTYLNLDAHNRAIQGYNLLNQTKKWTPQQTSSLPQTTSPQQSNPQLSDPQTEDGSSSFAAKLVKGFGEKTGLYNISDMGAEMAGMPAYFIPGVGNALSAVDAWNAASRGDWENAAMSAVFALPFIGNLGRVAKVGTQAIKMNKTANAIGKGANALLKVEKPANYALTAKMMYDTPKLVKDFDDMYQTVKLGKELFAPFQEQELALKLQGYSDSYILNQLMNQIGDQEGYNAYKSLTKYDNNFLGNLRSSWDLMNYNYGKR